MGSKRPALAAVSFACPVLAILYIFWIFEMPHDWPRGETGLIAIYAASLWSFAFLIAGVVAGTISLLRNEARRWAVSGIICNAAAAGAEPLSRIAVLISLAARMCRRLTFEAHRREPATHKKYRSRRTAARRFASGAATSWTAGLLPAHLRGSGNEPPTLASVRIRLIRIWFFAE